MEQVKQIIFEYGLPGFEELTNFTITVPFTDQPFFFLKSLDNTNISFLVVNPFEFSSSYEFELPDFVQESLDVQDISDVAVFNIINTSQGLNQATVNLQAPIVINIKKSKGMQVVLNDSIYSIREPLTNLLRGMEGE